MSGPPQPQRLNQKQSHALFDILTHHEIYSEIEAFKTTDGVLNHGYPFRNKEQLERACQIAPAPSGGGGLSAFAYSFLGRAGSSGATPTPSAPDSPRPLTPQPPVTSMGELSVDSDGKNDGDEEDAGLSDLPVLQLLLSTFVLRLPALKTLPQDFWAVRVQGLLSRFADADLSESYDKGAMGARKTLATGASSVLEMISRGTLGGVGRKHKQDAGVPFKEREYSSANCKDVERAWEDVLQEMIYGDLVDDLFAYMGKTDDVEAHSPAAKSAIHYIVIHLAAFLHHIFIQSPDGPYLLKLLDNVHRLIPYLMIKQTLRIGNAATMMNGMMRLLLAKLSVTSITNWVGLTQNDDDGMNLLQNIISMVLSHDSAEFTKSVQRISKNTASDGPSEAMLQAIRDHVDGSRSDHEALRRESRVASESIVIAIFNARDPTLTNQLTEDQHTQCLEYYSALLSVRDRAAITSVLCHQSPDLFTRALKDGITAHTSMIRTVHERVDLGDHLQDLQEFITEFIRVSIPDKANPGREVTVEDYAQLLHAKKHLLHKWIHALAAKCPDIWEDLRLWSNASIAKFRQESSNGSTDAQGASAMDESLNGLVSGLDEPSRQSVLAAVDSHAQYLATLKNESDARLEYIIAVTRQDGATGAAAQELPKPQSTGGPGMYLSRWRDILDNTLVTAADKEQPVAPRHGRDVLHLVTMGKKGMAGHMASEEERKKKSETEAVAAAPDVLVVVEALGDGFHALMQAINFERRPAARAIE